MQLVLEFACDVVVPSLISVLAVFLLLENHSESQDLKGDTSKNCRKGSGTLPSE